MKVGIVLPTRGLFLAGGEPDVSQVVKLAVRAEQLGLDGVWAGDSLTAKPRLEPLTVLAAVSGRTERVTLGTSVLLAALRSPVPLAQTTATLHRLSGGRLVLGIGVGGVFNEAQRGDWHAAGVDPAGRGARTTEIVSLLRQLWRGEPVTHHGRYFDLDNVSVGYSSGATPPRLLLACHSGDKRDAQYNRAAGLGDGMISISDTPEEMRDVRADVLRRVQQTGRDPAEFKTTFYMTVNLNADEPAAAAEADTFIRGYYGVNFWGERWGPFGKPERILERARRYAEAGADEMVFRFAARDQAAQLELFAQTILPALR